MIAGLFAIVFLCVVELGLALFVVRDKTYPGDAQVNSMNDPYESIFKSRNSS